MISLKFLLAGLIVILILVALMCIEEWMRREKR